MRKETTKTSVVLLGIVGILLTGWLYRCSANDSQKESGSDMKSSRQSVSVNHEWGTLKEVIVGRGEDMVLPSYCDAVSFIYDPKYIEMMKKDGGKPIGEVEPESAKMVIEQINGLAKVLKQRGVIVHRPRRLTNPAEKRYMADVQKGSFFLMARDPILVIGNNVIETAIKIPFRAKERYAIRPIIRKRIKGTGTKHVAVPAVSPAFREDGIYLEGGDVMLNGYEIYVGNSGRGSNKAGIEWLQNYLGPEYKVREIKLNPEFEHLDCVLALLRPGLGLICRKGIQSELPESLRNWDFVEVSVDEAKKLGANCMVLDDKTVIMAEHQHRIAEVLRKKGHNVIEIPYDQVVTWGGGFRCSHHPLRRESKLEQ